MYGVIYIALRISFWNSPEIIHPCNFQDKGKEVNQVAKFILMWEQPFHMRANPTGPTVMSYFDDALDHTSSF